jgi:hypothetical protein
LQEIFPEPVWHMNCGSTIEFKIMATKDKFMRLIQEVRGLAEIRRHQPAPKHSPLYLVQLRSHLNATSRPKTRLIINADLKEIPSFPDPVKITHLKADSGV